MLHGVEVWAEVFLFPRYDDWDCNSLTAEIVPVLQFWTFWHTEAHASHRNKLFSGVIGTFTVLSNIFRNDRRFCWTVNRLSLKILEYFVELSIDFLLKSLFLFSNKFPQLIQWSSIFFFSIIVTLDKKGGR